jgi:hypothetical protein
MLTSDGTRGYTQVLGVDSGLYLTAECIEGITSSFFPSHGCSLADSLQKIESFLPVVTLLKFEYLLLISAQKDPARNAIEGQFRAAINFSMCDQDMDLNCL